MYLGQLNISIQSVTGPPNYTYYIHFALTHENDEVFNWLMNNKQISGLQP